MSGSLKHLEFGQKARDHILEGVATLADAVRVTLGPRGNNVVIEVPGHPPIVTKDGVTVAKAINLRNRYANLGAQIVKEAASRACDVAGDGTTTATVLTHAIFSEGQRLLNAGYSSLELRQGIEEATHTILQELDSKSKRIEGSDAIVSVGTISANGEREIGELLAKAFDAVGNEGVVTVEEAKGFSTTLNVTEGAELDRGYTSPYFVTDQDKMVADLKDPYILITNRKISNMRELVPLLEKILSASKPLVIVADDVEGEALQGLVMNKAKGVVQTCVLRAPEFGDGRIPALEDLATLLGCKLFLGGPDELSTITLADLGSCDRMIVNRNRTVIVRPKGSRESIENRVKAVREKLNDPTLSDEMIKFHHRRLARLSGAVAVIRVGGATEMELRERRDRVDDALHATRAAMESGVLPGGGSALAQATKSLKNLERGQSEAYRAGVRVVRKACLSPIEQILENAGVSSERIIERLVREDYGIGYDAANLEWCDMLERGVIDPAKVVCSSLEHAASAALMLLSVGASVVEDTDQFTSEDEEV
jgi:chaperonin GroEL